MHDLRRHQSVGGVEISISKMYRCIINLSHNVCIYVAKQVSSNPHPSSKIARLSVLPVAATMFLSQTPMSIRLTSWFCQWNVLLMSALTQPETFLDIPTYVLLGLKPDLQPILIILISIVFFRDLIFDVSFPIMISVYRSISLIVSRRPPSPSLPKCSRTPSQPLERFIHPQLFSLRLLFRLLLRPQPSKPLQDPTIDITPLHRSHLSLLLADSALESS